jgi:hypothetical protein
LEALGWTSGNMLMTGTPEWLRDLQFWSRRMRSRLYDKSFSNLNEDKLIEKYVGQLGIASANNTAVDIGAGDGIKNSNTFRLFSSGWRGLGIEADPARYGRLRKAYSGLADVRAVHAAVTPENVVGILRSNGIESDLALLSLDIDGNDYWVLDAILSEFRPRLVVSEYNEKIPPPIGFVVRYDPEFRLRSHLYGYSITKLDDLLTKHHYSLIDVEYNNVFISPREIAAEYSKPVRRAYDEGYANRPDRRERFPQNADMEPLQFLSPHEGIDFLAEKYPEYAGTYEIEVKEV